MRRTRPSCSITDLDVAGVPNVFAVDPSIDEDGVLHFTTGSEVGSAQVAVRAHDDGGLDVGHADRMARASRENSPTR